MATAFADELPGAGIGSSHMIETRHSERLIWVCIFILAISVIGAQTVEVAWRASAHAPRVRPLPPRPARTLIVAVPREVPSAEELAPATESASTVELFLEAIVQVESSGNPLCVGKAGERGLMQLKREAWQDAASTIFAKPPPFDRAFDPDLNRRVGQAYLAQLQRFLLENRPLWRDDMRSLLTACYNAGPNRVEAAGFSVRSLPETTRSYVERVTTLHDYYLAHPAADQFAKRPVGASGS